MTNDVGQPADDAASFLVAVVASSREQAAAQFPDSYGEASSDWRAFVGSVTPVATRTAEAAIRLGLPVRIVDIAQERPDLGRSPGLVLVDPWSCEAMGDNAVRALLAGLPDWVMPVVLFNQHDGDYGERGSLLAHRIADMLESIGVTRVVIINASEEFSQRVPRLVLDARRQFLSKARVFPPPGAPTPRPRFSGDPWPPSRLR